MRDVESGAVDGFVGSGLEDVGAEDAARRPTDDVNRGVVIHQLLTPCSIQGALHKVADLHRPIHEMEDVLALLPGVHHATVGGFGGQATMVALLAAAFGVEAGLVQNDRVCGTFDGRMEQGLAGEDTRFHLQHVHIVVEQKRGAREFGERFNQGRVFAGRGGFLGQTRVTFSHFSRETRTKHEVIPTGLATHADHDFRLQTVHICEFKQKIVVHRRCILRRGFEGLSDQTV